MRPRFVQVAALMMAAMLVCWAMDAKARSLQPSITLRENSPGPLPEASVPNWVIQIPRGHFVGVSPPRQSMAAARDGAIESAVSQILQAMGASYHLSHESTIIGSRHASRCQFKERLVFQSKWLLREVHHGIRECRFQRSRGGYVCFVLVNFPSSRMDGLRRLTLGPQLSARFMGRKGNKLLVRAREVNGVGVTLTRYKASILTRNRLAAIITLFAFKVPKSSRQQWEGTLERKLTLCNTTSALGITLPPTRNGEGLGSFLLGSETQFHITLYGYDQLGRRMSLQVTGH